MVFVAKARSDYRGIRTHFGVEDVLGMAVKGIPLWDNTLLVDPAVRPDTGRKAAGKIATRVRMRNKGMLKDDTSTTHNS